MADYIVPLEDVGNECWVEEMLPNERHLLDVSMNEAHNCTNQVVRWPVPPIVDCGIRVRMVYPA